MQNTHFKPKIVHSKTTCAFIDSKCEFTDVFKNDKGNNLRVENDERKN